MSEQPTDKPTFLTVVGGSYIDRETGKTFILEGLRSKQRVCLIHDARGPGRDVRDYTPIEDLKAGYDFGGCDHENSCCSHHRIHVSPHRGCLMR